MSRRGISGHFCYTGKGKNAEAETALRDLVRNNLSDPNVRVSSRHLLGVVLDELGQYAEAMKWLREAKKQLRQTRDPGALEREYEKAEAQRREVAAGLTRAMLERWRSEAASAPARHQLALLGGHPRSGTTLLEQVLGAHPEVLAFDESEAFVNEIGNQLATAQASKPLTAEALDAVDATKLGHDAAALLEEFFARGGRRAGGAGAGGQKSVHDGVAAPVFAGVSGTEGDSGPARPSGRRRCTVISCYFQNLALTAANVNFLNLERTARHYADMMEVWLRLRELGGFEWVETRYEDMVSDLEGGSPTGDGIPGGWRGIFPTRPPTTRRRARSSFLPPLTAT